MLEEKLFIAYDKLCLLAICLKRLQFILKFVFGKFRNVEKAGNRVYTKWGSAENAGPESPDKSGLENEGTGNGGRKRGT